MHDEQESTLNAKLALHFIGVKDSQRRYWPVNVGLR